MRNKYDVLKDVLEKMGHKFFTGELNINLIGVRNENEFTNQFDDKLLVAIEMNNVRQVIEFDEFTTDPGDYYLKKKFLNPKGCFVLKPGQYAGMFKFGLHRGKYKALVQAAKCTGYRDRNKDNTINTNMEVTGVYGINMHHAYDAPNNIDKYSAGCQVHRDVRQLGSVLGMCKASAEKFGGTFTYTLIMKSDLPEEFFNSAPINEEE